MKKRFILFTTCAVLTLGLGVMAFSACGEEGKVKEHDHVWSDTYTTTKRATCSEEGEKVRFCTVPGCTAQDPEKVKIDKLPHTWGAEPTNTATCEEAGAIVWTCTVCGAQEEGNPVPALGHDDVVQEVTRNATCEQEGENLVKCMRCGRTTTVTTNKLEHDFRYDKEKSVEPTCTKPGKEVYTCVNGCNKSEETPLEMLEHEVKYESYEEPTFEAAGHRKGICVNCNTSIDEEIPMLVDGEEMEFSFKLMKGKRAFYSNTMTLTVVDKEGKTVASGTGKDIIGGRYKVKLPIHEGTEYTLKLGNIPGYVAEEVTLTPVKTSGEVQLSARMYEIEDTDAPQLYTAGSMMQDFKLTDIDGNEVHLKDLLKTNRLLMIDLFFSTCNACNYEAPNLQELYTEYKSKGLMIIGVSSDAGEYDSSTGKVDDEKIKAFREEFGITFPLIRQPDPGEGKYLYERFGINSFPTTVYIDHEGFVKMVVTGAHVKSAVETLIQNYLSTEFEDLDGEKTVSPKPQEDGLTLSVLRGDYLPGDEKNN